METYIASSLICGAYVPVEDTDKTQVNWLITTVTGNSQFQGESKCGVRRTNEAKVSLLMGGQGRAL